MVLKPAVPSQLLTPEEQQRQKEQELRREHVIYFDFDRSEVQPEFLEIIQAHGNYLLENPNVRILIEGHTDERGTPEYNIALGERRAKAVAKYLQSMGVQPSQISIVSYGEEKPLDLSHTPMKDLPRIVAPYWCTDNQEYNT